jgi:hypothetical protein
MAAFIASMLALVAMFLIMLGVEELSCSTKAEKMGFKSDYGPVQGCMILVDKHWIPIEQYRTLGGVD